MKTKEQNTLPLDYGFNDMLFETLQKAENTIVESKLYNIWKSLGIDIQTGLDASQTTPKLLVKATTYSNQYINITVGVGLGTLSFAISYEEDGIKHDHFYYAYDMSMLLDGINKILLGTGW